MAQFAQGRRGWVQRLGNWKFQDRSSLTADAAMARLSVIDVFCNRFDRRGRPLRIATDLTDVVN
jgi:hypothetical protein